MSHTTYMFYTEANIVVIIIFGVLLVNEFWRSHRSDRQIKFDNVMMAHILYFLSDIIWASVLAGKIPATTLSIAFPNFTNFVFLSFIAYTWFCFAASTGEMPLIRTRKGRNLVRLPMVIMTVLFLVNFIAAPDFWVGPGIGMNGLYYPLMMLAPLIYIFAAFFYSIGKARRAVNADDRRAFLSIAIYPLTVVIGGIIQIWSTDMPVFCFCCAIMMLIFYVRSMNDQISIDPLTNLNNRGQINRYNTQEGNLRHENLLTFTVMIDVNDFKLINDTYGHVEGDRALILVADSLKTAVGRNGISSFIGRYGGDEFILIVYARSEDDLPRLAEGIRQVLHEQGEKEQLPYDISLSIGYDRLDADETFQMCLERADKKLYDEKKARKRALGRGIGE